MYYSIYNKTYFLICLFEKSLTNITTDFFSQVKQVTTSKICDKLLTSSLLIYFFKRIVISRICTFECILMAAETKIKVISTVYYLVVSNYFYCPNKIIYGLQRMQSHGINGTMRQKRILKNNKKNFILCKLTILQKVYIIKYLHKVLIMNVKYLMEYQLLDS